MVQSHPIRCLHQQADAEIFLCVTDTTREPVVTKTIYRPTSPPDEDLPRHASSIEAMIVSKLLQLQPHPNVLRYTQVKHERDAVLLTMEYCPHGDLLSWLEQQPHNKFNETAALCIFAQALRGVHFLHTHGIAHRDLSLENLLVAKDQVIKICDFGLATPTANQLANDTVGKHNYMAPEVVAGKWYDPKKADLWSLGIILFILLTGSPLFEVADASDATFRVFESLGVTGVLRHWRIDHTVSASTQSLLSQLLRVDPSARCASVDQVMAQLRTEP